MEKTIYTFILCKEDGSYLGWSKAKDEIESGEDMQWVKWDKTLPDDIDSIEYKYIKGKLKRI